MSKYPSVPSRRLPHAAIACACMLALASGAQAASWTKLTNGAPGSTDTMFLLTDGTVMVKTGDGTFSRLTPDAKGDYSKGTWSSMAPMGTPREYFASHVLPNGNVWILGGEYSGVGLPANWTNTGEIYDTVKDKWTPITHHPDASYGDVPSMLMENGVIMTGALQTRNTYFYDTATDTWTTGPQKFYNDRSDEEGFAKLGDGSVFVYDVFFSISAQSGHAEVYDPKANSWSGRSPADGSASGTLPILSTSAVGDEMGPTMTLRSPKHKGQVLAVGADGHTALFTVGTKVWKALPDLMDKVNGVNTLFGADDAPGAEMPSGHVILAADTGPTNGTFSPPTHLFDYDPVAQTFSPVDPPVAGMLDHDPAFVLRMLMLPTGQMLFSSSTKTLYIYNPDGKADKAAKPVFNDLFYNGSGKFTLTGKQLNGVSGGAAYGDDAEMDENYPIVSFKDANGNVYYGRTTNWSNTRVRDKKSETVDLTLKPGMPAGDYDVTISGAGIQSKATCLTITAAEAGGTGSAGDVMPCN
jgi:hypothetical protein